MMSRIDLSEKVANTERRFGAAKAYYPARIVYGAREYPAMFTARQISAAMQRAGANPEDWPVPRKSWWQRICGRWA